MNPVVFDGAFGWLHPAAGSMGVVLCNPFGYDALCTHDGWRKLAERLAASGLPTLRFDYPGTGDAAGTEEDPGRVEAWLASVESAVQHLRAWTGVTRVALVGLRLGATIAALAAQRLGDANLPGVDALVLLAPTVTGRRHIRELRARRQTWVSTSAEVGAASSADPADPMGLTDHVEAFGFGLHGEDIAALSAIDLMNDTRAPAPHILLLDSSGTSLATSLATHYQGYGVQVDLGSFEESDRFLRDPLYSDEPTEAFERLSAWLSERSATVPEGGPVAGPRASPIPVETGPELRLDPHRATERPVRFGPCFGIYCEPDAPQADVPAVLLINTGAAYRIGDGRFSVLLARRLAEHGIASLRMDVGGLGDAIPAAREVTRDMLHAMERRDEAATAVNWLVGCGHPRVAAFGVCSGAFVSLYLCEQHPNVVAAYGVNMQEFTWDATARTVGDEGTVSSRTYLSNMLSVDRWKRALRGQSKSNPLRIAVMLAKRGFRRGVYTLAHVIEQKTGWPASANAARALLRHINAKKVQLRLAFGEFDLGLEEARIQLGASFAALRSLENVHAVTLPGLDHALFTREARRAVMADFEAWLCSEPVRKCAVAAGAEFIAESGAHSNAEPIPVAASCISATVRT
jgi:pimeloyl-ACP methyl ester carboxylesterase